MGHQLLLPEMPPEPPPLAGAAPFLKWAGGKAWLAPRLAGGVRGYLARTGGAYHEPFLGAGAVALHLGWPRMVLSDALKGLIDLHGAVRDNPSAVMTTVSGLVRRHGLEEPGYLAVRASRPLGQFATAARFLYLNRLCFNGLYRENRSGEFNVPFGKPVKKAFPVTLETLQAAASALAGARISVRDFQPAIQMAKPGDVVFCDPPYDGGFDGYTSAGFGAQAQEALAWELESAGRRGVAVVTTNADTPLVRDLYGWARHVVETSEARSINSDKDGRGKKGCLLISNVLGEGAIS